MPKARSLWFLPCLSGCHPTPTKCSGGSKQRGNRVGAHRRFGAWYRSCLYSVQRLPLLLDIVGDTIAPKYTRFTQGNGSTPDVVGMGDNRIGMEGPKQAAAVRRSVLHRQKLCPGCLATKALS